MKSEKRAFHRSFVTHARLNGVFPELEVARNWCVDRDDEFMNDGAYRQAQRGDAVNLDQIEKIIGCIRDLSRQNNTQAAGLDSYLRFLGRDPARLLVSDVID